MQETSVFHSETFPPTQRVGEERVGRISKKNCDFTTCEPIWEASGEMLEVSLHPFRIMFVFFLNPFEASTF